MFRALVFQRGNLLSGAIADLSVLKASINEDLTQKATSTITCLSIPTNVQQNDVVRLYDTKGKFVYWGIVNGIDNNTLKCSQFQALFNDNFLFLITSDDYKPYFDDFTISQMIEAMLSCRMYGLISNTTDSFVDKDVANNYKGITTSTNDTGSERFPYFTENVTKNLETFLYEMFNTYNRIIVPSWVSKGFDYWVTGSDYMVTHENDNYIFENRLPIGQQHIDILCCNPVGKIELADGNTLDFNYRVLFDSYENISNLNIVKQDEDTNTVYISGDNGFRGAYTVDVNGNIVQIQNNTSVIGRLGTNKTKYIFDNDNNVLDLARSELPTTQYNHKITFDILFDENNKFKDYILAQKIKFFDNENNRLFDTLLTARKYEIVENSDVIKKATFTLGKARTSLTSLINKRQ